MSLLCVSEVLVLLETLGSDRTLLKESVLIGCTEQNQVQFCLDVGEHRAVTPRSPPRPLLRFWTGSGFRRPGPGGGGGGV